MGTGEEKGGWHLYMMSALGEGKGFNRDLSSIDMRRRKSDSTGSWEAGREYQPLIGWPGVVPAAHWLRLA